LGEDEEIKLPDVVETLGSNNSAAIVALVPGRTKGSVNRNGGRGISVFGEMLDEPFIGNDAS
jgi:hypothetical protein